VSEHPPTGSTRFTTWLDEHAEHVGRSYESELSRNYRRLKIRVPRER